MAGFGDAFREFCSDSQKAVSDRKRISKDEQCLKNQDFVKNSQKPLAADGIENIVCGVRGEHSPPFWFMDATSPAVIGGKTTTEFGYNSKIEGEVVHTTVDAALNWFRKNSLWPMPMGLACCGIELMAVGASRFDISRFGSEVMRFSPAVRCHDRGRYGDLQDGPGRPPHL